MQRVFLPTVLRASSPGRKRCLLSEIRNPNFESGKTGGRGEVGSTLTLVALVFVFFFGLQSIWQVKKSEVVTSGQVRQQMAHEEIAKAILPKSAVVSNNSFGWIAFVAKPLYFALRFLHDHGVGNWGWSIIVLTVIFNLLIIWPRILSMNSSLKMMRIQPKVDAVKKRYAHLKINDPRQAEMSAEMMALYRAEGANMFGGCVPLLLQMPLLFAFLSVLRNAGELHQAHWLWLTDLAMPDPLHILPLLIIGSMVLTQWITPAPSMNTSHRWLLAILMPAAMGLSLWRYASGLSLYWATGNVVNLLIQLLINRSSLGKEMHALASHRRTIDPNTSKR